jgi:hypothetical protein
MAPTTRSMFDACIVQLDDICKIESQTKAKN